jgi:hypothetical protein
MPSRKPQTPQSAVRALADLGMNAQQIQMTASRIGAMSATEIEMILLRRQRRPEPTPEASSDLVGLVAKVRVASKRRTNADVLTLIADEFEDQKLVQSGRHLGPTPRETVAQWLARMSTILPEDSIRGCLERLLDAYSSGARLRRVK